MRIEKLTIVLIGLINFVNCAAQDSIVTKTVKKDTATITTGIVYQDVDLNITKLDKELDSLYRVYKFTYASNKTNLSASSKAVKDYIKNLIKNGGFDKNTNLTTTNVIYDFKFKNSTLSQELEKYIKSINELDLNATVKKVAINKIQRVNNIKAIESYTHKYNCVLTILKIQLYKVLWSEIYIIDNESIDKVSSPNAIRQHND
jgi:hypothetical protein